MVMLDQLKAVTEFFVSEGHTVEDGVLKNIVVCGSESKHNREYTKEYHLSAVNMYEGMRVYLNHPVRRPDGKMDLTRKAEDRFGHLENVRYVESENKTRGDLRYLTTHPMAKQVKESYEKKLPYFGLSHIADVSGTKDRETGRVRAMKADRIYSVDLVDTAATGTLVEQEGMDYAAQMMDGMAQMVVAIVCDKSIDKATKMKRIESLMDTMESGEKPAETGGTGEQKPPPAQEQAVLLTQLGSLVEQAVAKQTQALETKINTLTEQAVEKVAKEGKYIRPRTTEEPPARTVTKQAVPKDPESRKKWLHSR